mgnify:CR=1 FL=1
MDDQSRLAIHKAVATTIRAEAQPTIDVYQREARGLLTPGLSRKDASKRISVRMGLEAAASSDANTQLWHIVQSNVYSGLRVSYSDGALVSWVLIRTDGTSGV